MPLATSTATRRAGSVVSWLVPTAALALAALVVGLYFLLRAPHPTPAPEPQAVQAPLPPLPPITVPVVKPAPSPTARAAAPAKATPASAPAMVRRTVRPKPARPMEWNAPSDDDLLDERR